MTRQRRDLKKEELWRRVVRRQARSGLSVRAWCRKHNLQQSAFYWWRRELARRDVEAAETTSAHASTRSPSPAFVPVRLTEDGSAKSDPVIEIILTNGRRIRLRGAVNRQALTDVLAVLESKPAGGEAGGNEVCDAGVGRRRWREGRAC